MSEGNGRESRCRRRGNAAWGRRRKEEERGEWKEWKVGEGEW